MEERGRSDPFFVLVFPCLLYREPLTIVSTKRKKFTNTTLLTVKIKIHCFYTINVSRITKILFLLDNPFLDSSYHYKISFETPVNILLRNQSIRSIKRIHLTT